MISRTEHVDWSKRRALEYLDAGDLVNAVASMGSDMNKRHDTKIPPPFYALGLQHVMRGDVRGLREWIEGFQ